MNFAHAGSYLPSNNDGRYDSVGEIEFIKGVGLEAPLVAISVIYRE
jgi:hypothetical protein